MQANCKGIINIYLKYMSHTQIGSDDFACSARMLRAEYSYSEIIFQINHFSMAHWKPGWHPKSHTEKPKL